MARSIEEEAWDYAPKALTSAAYLTLIRLADSAGRDHRMVWISVKTLMRYTRAGRGTVYRALIQLTQLNIVVEVPREEWPPEAARYDSVVRRINPVSEWKLIFNGTKDVPGDLVNLSPADTTPSPADSHFGTKIDSQNENDHVPKWDPNQEPINQELERAKKTSSSLERQGALRRQRPSGSSSRGQAEDDDLDPADFVEHHPEPTAEPRRPRGAPGSDTGMGLAVFFSTAMLGSGGMAAIPDPANHRKLALIFNRWRKQGLQPDQIRSMIEKYAATPDLRNSNYIPWRDFVYKRAQIFASVLADASLEFQDKVMNDPASQEYEDYWGTSADYSLPHYGGNQ